MNIQTSIGTLPVLTPPLPRQHTRKRLPLVIGLAALLALGLLGWRYGMPYAVRSERAHLGSLDVELKGPGTLTALTEARVSSRIQARVEQLLVDRNDRVTKGDVLARLAYDDLAGELAASEASARAAERAISTAEAERDRAIATRDKAQADHERQRSLLARGVASQATMDDAHAALRQAEADLVRTERSVDRAAAERDSAQARITVARAQLGDSVLAAPIDGIIVSRSHQIGDLLTPGTELLHIVDPARLVLTARLDESAIASITPGQHARVTFGERGTAIPAHVLRIAREVDEETREFEVDVALERLPENWAMGQRGTARITADQRSAVLTARQSFLARRDGVPGLWIAEHGRARWQAVSLGAFGTDYVEITRGLSAGDVVLAPAGLYSFMRVRPAGDMP